VLTEFYGSTEGQFTACSDASGWPARARSGGLAGRTLHIETGAAPRVRRERQSGDLVPRTGVRPVLVLAPARRHGRRLGWRRLHCRDLGWLDDEGYLYIAGRREDLIITGGVNVYPAEVETAIAAFPGRRRRRLRHARRALGRAGLCGNRGGAPIDVDALRADLAGRLAPAKRPKEYTLVARCPHPSGKLVRRALSTPGAPAGGPEAEKG